MTTVTVTMEVPSGGKTEDRSIFSGPSSAQIIEETEYVRKIRTTLEKIRNRMFKEEDGRGNARHKVDAEQSGNVQNGLDSTTDPTRLDLLLESMRRKDQQLLEMNKENEVLQIKLEASREAGAAALRNAAQRLFDNYQTQSEDLEKKHKDSKHVLQVNKLEKEQTLKQRAKNLSQLSEKLGEKHEQIVGLENRVQRMENMEGLKNTLKEQDKKIENLKEKVTVLEAQNEELKTKVAHWTESPRTSVSKAVSTSELKTEGASPYLMLIRLRK
ncbi:coiled-coil domain-containing protein 68 [Rattus norvegicus]|uniref:Coiled-coil domain containing 68 n=1 Tax=Rattus norvegicus TaxID=10116 RepID=A0JPN5_RAT|nr:coiled-coil domain-containing protein 68 [Rattus norvegicus]AAI27518.1 Coiled-coil domain containing 68 [Rattus norvegicus]|eukprot:NP_001071135.1 coiled-coil domain-containing protein 68 [Rattus norvegicus]